MSPNFLIIGAMKAGSTTLFRWLGDHPFVRLPREKEPNFFSNEGRWKRGREWYASQFPFLSHGQITGEASVHYTDPDVASIAAERAASLLPDARLIFLSRNPIDRMRSHYRHEVQRGRETRPFLDAIRDPLAGYVRMSRYRDGLAPWRERFEEHRLRIVQFDELFGDSEGAWLDLLSFLGLEAIPRPITAHNVTAEKRPYRPLMRVLYDAGAARYERLVPRWIKKLARPVLIGGERGDLMATSRHAVPHEVESNLLAHATP